MAGPLIGMRHPFVGGVVLLLSGIGFPLTQLAVRRFGRRGALLVEAVSVGLLARDTAMIAMGTPRHLHRGPAMLLWLEAGAAALAAVTGLRLLVDGQARERAIAARPSRFEVVRRGAVGTLFGLHTMRFRIYLQPDRGLRPVD